MMRINVYLICVLIDHLDACCTSLEKRFIWTLCDSTTIHSDL